MSEWRPISEAPRDGTRAHWVALGIDKNAGPVDPIVTHFMPLPPPPETGR